MKSMTGYGFRETIMGKYSVYLEVKSYNNRYLDIQVTVPSYYSPLEPRIRSIIGERIERGRVEVACRVRELEENLQIMVDTVNARTYADALTKLADAAGIEPEVHLGHLIRMEGILKFERSRDVEDFWPVFSPVLREVLEDFEETRNSEGRRTEEYIRNQLEIITGEFGTISSNAGRLESLLAENLRRRFSEIADNTVDESRIASETAVLLVKYSIGEEIDRFLGHTENFLKTLEHADGHGVSKKLDFICQEMNREINTIASKSFLLEVNQAVIDIKDGIEKIREQLRNVE